MFALELALLRQRPIAVRFVLRSNMLSNFSTRLISLRILGLGGGCTGSGSAGAVCAGVDCAGVDCTGVDCAGVDCAGADCAGFTLTFKMRRGDSVSGVAEAGVGVEGGVT